MPVKPLGQHVADWIRHMLSCCDRCSDEEEQRPALQISAPTNFRREDITILGLDPDQQAFIRAKAIADAQKLYTSLQRLPSATDSPLTTPSYHDFTTPRSAPVTTTPSQRHSAGWGEKFRAHGRKISNSLTPFADKVGGGGALIAREDSKYEMRALIQPEEAVAGKDPRSANGYASPSASLGMGDREGELSGESDCDARF